MDKHVVEKIKNNKSRWTAFVKGYPCYLIQQKSIKTIPSLEK